MDLTAANARRDAGGLQPIDTQPRDAWKQLVLRLLTVGATNRLLDELSAAWREWTRARAAFLFVLPEGRQPLRGRWMVSGQSPQPVECRTAIADPWTPHAVLSLLSQLVPQAAQPEFNTGLPELFVFQDEGKRLGGVLLLQAEPRVDSPSEVAFLVELSSRLVAQSQRQDQAAAAGLLTTDLQAAKLEAMAELAAGAGHEINNPLAAISGRVQLLLRHESDPERKQALQTIGGQAERIRDMIGDLMLFARPPEPVCEMLCLDDVARTVVERLRSRADDVGGSLGLQAAAPVPIWADPTQLAVAIASLVENSLEAAGPGGQTALAAASVTDGGRPMALLSCTDNGPGLSAVDREHLFDPFYSGRQAGRGLGFGLSKCWRIVSNHRGRIEVESIPGVETRFRVFWPASVQPASSAAV